MYSSKLLMKQTSLRLHQYFMLTKPRIVVLLALTGIVAYYQPNTGTAPDLLRLVIFVTCGYFAAGGAMAVNNAIDIDIDQKMDRTRNRPSIEDMSALHVTVFGSGLMILAFAVSYAVFGLFTSIYLMWGSLFYIFAYTLWLKRNSWLNTILGGLASPAPVWAAYAARYEVANMVPENSFMGVPVEGWLLGSLVFLWTPSHTWAMAVKNYDDYVSAEVPMLPVIIGIERTAKINLIATIGLIVFVLTSFSQPAIRWWIGFWVSIPFLLASVYFAMRPSVETGTSNFHAHNIWLALIFISLI